MNLAEYYASELTFLRETARAFAQEHPALAGALRGTDPDVERLLEGGAFMTAGLRARIDHSGAQVAHGLAELVLPHYLRSLPATTIVEFLPNPKTLRLRQRVPAERPLLARAVDGTVCRFRTCFPGLAAGTYGPRLGRAVAPALASNAQPAGPRRRRFAASTGRPTLNAAASTCARSTPCARSGAKQSPASSAARRSAPSAPSAVRLRA